MFKQLADLVGTQVPHLGVFRNGVVPLDVHRGLYLLAVDIPAPKSIRINRRVPLSEAPDDGSSRLGERALGVGQLSRIRQNDSDYPRALQDRDRAHVPAKLHERGVPETGYRLPRGMRQIVGCLVVIVTPRGGGGVELLGNDRKAGSSSRSEVGAAHDRDLVAVEQRLFLLTQGRGRFGLCEKVAVAGLAGYTARFSESDCC
jgi:hypothetical protein